MFSIPAADRFAAADDDVLTRSVIEAAVFVDDADVTGAIPAVVVERAVERRV